MKNITGINRLILVLLFFTLFISCKKEEKKVDCKYETITISLYTPYTAPHSGQVWITKSCYDGAWIKVNGSCTNLVKDFKVDINKGDVYEVNSPCLNTVAKYDNECD